MIRQGLIVLLVLLVTYASGAQVKAVEVSDVGAKVIAEHGEFGTRIEWTVTLQNFTRQEYRVYVRVFFQDAYGSNLDHDWAWVVLKPREIRTITGQKMLDYIDIQRFREITASAGWHT